MPGSNACASDPFGRTVRPKSTFWRKADMTGARPALSRRLRMMGAAISLGAAGVLASAPVFARGPDGIADIAEKVIDAVVNISTSQNVDANKGGGGGDRQANPQLPRG